MISFFEEILKKYKGKNIALVSHAAAIKYFLQHFCYYDVKTNVFLFKNQTICSAKLESPSVLELVFSDNNLKKIKKINL